MTKPKTYLIVAGLIRRGNEILLVKQKGADDPEPTWALPGGVVERGELLHEALRREVFEETGLIVGEIGKLIYAVQVDSALSETTSVAFVFDTPEWKGELAVKDPGYLVLAANFLPLEEAILRLESLSWSAMREPIVAYLRGEASPGTVWLYRNDADEAGERLIAHLGE